MRDSKCGKNVLLNDIGNNLPELVMIIIITVICSAIASTRLALIIVLGSVSTTARLTTDGSPYLRTGKLTLNTKSLDAIENSNITLICGGIRRSTLAGAYVLHLLFHKNTNTNYRTLSREHEKKCDTCE